MYKLEVYSGVDLIRTVIFIEGEESELRDYITKYELDGCMCRVWKETKLKEV